MNVRNIIALALIATGATGAAYMHQAGGTPDAPAWLEPDSATAIQSRLAYDFSLTLEEAADRIRQKYPEVTDSDVAEFARKGYIETREIDGRTMVHRRSPGNMPLLNPTYNGGRIPPRGEGASAARISYVDSVLDCRRGTNPVGAAHAVTYRFGIAVPYHEAIVGDTLRVWMPIPMPTRRQSEPEILSTSQSDFIVSTPEQSVHRTVYMSAPAPQPGDTARFYYTARFVTRGEYFSPDQIRRDMRPYDTSSPLYRRYTAFEDPHIVRLDSLARAIVGPETNPLACSEAIYDYTITHFPWAGAREYSTIECIPEYVLATGHGDCGQVALLYISLMRSLGIPARWESGWMMHPGEVNLHDWAEVYFEGVGWVPVDVSFGRYTAATSPEAVNFYSTGMDAHRFATNQGVCSPLYPPKKFLRSESVDFQLGEVECSRGNLFYPGWIREGLDIIEEHPVAE